MLKPKTIHVVTADDVLIRNRGNQVMTAKQLGICRSNLSLWIKAKLLKDKLVRVEYSGDFEEKLTLINHNREQGHRK